MEGGHHRGLNPPAYFLAALIAVVVLAVAVPASPHTSPPLQIAGMALIAMGLWLNIRGAGQFERAGTPIRPSSRSGALVTDGVFRFSRNPMYLGLASMLLGAALTLGSVVALVVVPAFAWVLDRDFIRREEWILENEFGEAYRTYQDRVSRWL